MADDRLPTHTETMDPGMVVESVSAHVAIAPGTAIGRYVVESELGAGGVGVVLKARDPQLNRRVAIKLLQVGQGGDMAPAMLVREAQAIAQLNHPNVVMVHDVGEHEGELFIAMELVQGESLKDWMEAGPHPWREVIGVFVQAARGLEAAHAMGLVHRDFKPSNAIVGRDGRVRVLDFGLARIFDAPVSGDTMSEAAGAVLAQTLSRVGMVGTPAYMSPEQFMAEIPDARSDVFSFCVSLYEALYGQRPFGGATIIELRGNVMSGTFAPTGRDRSVPAWLDRIVKKGLALKPADRFGSMTELIAALEAGPRRRRRVVLGAAMATIVLAGVAIAVAGAPALSGQRAGAPSDAGAAQVVGADAAVVVTRAQAADAGTGAVVDAAPPIADAAPPDAKAPARVARSTHRHNKRAGTRTSTRKQPRRVTTHKPPVPSLLRDNPLPHIAAADKLNDRGKKLFRSRHYAEAEAMFARAVAIQRSQRYLFNLCYAQHKQNKLAAMRRSCAEAARGPLRAIRWKARRILEFARKHHR